MFLSHIAEPFYNHNVLAYGVIIFLGISFNDVSLCIKLYFLFSFFSIPVMLDIMVFTLHDVFGELGLVL